ncbi:hypothetical protein LOC68_00930 [Blastopirellula sp. JC732]|uniref:Uncharacterized protein n=1 Tax=Blastopirellula sediminis TaxID=2894196 RepID=A0A9X1MH25_9BACT|nr:hypothetical protein [Blastopirellula sediminis]MCC9608249.1 hypothetical protein [Blastopirellula sediminis]MCC9626958.1 hypothetical protein [Blastopirellula sediminis]
MINFTSCLKFAAIALIASQLTGSMSSAAEPSHQALAAQTETVAYSHHYFVQFWCSGEWHEYDDCFETRCEALKVKRQFEDRGYPARIVCE